MVDSHRISEHVSLLTHRIYVERIEQDHDMLARARDLLAQRIDSNGGTLGERMWRDLLRQAWPEVRQSMLAETPDGRLLRSSSPFSILIGVRNVDARRQLWRTARQDLSVATT